MADSEDRGWGNGWPDCDRSKIKTLVRRDGLRIPLRVEILPLVAWLMDETERRGYDIRPDWTWGYACRAIRGSSKPSNHSWGLAVDINAPKNPMTSRLITDMPPWMPKLWKDHGFAWGGDYRSRPDAMHYEFMGTPADAARYIRNLGTTLPPSPGDDFMAALTEAEQREILEGVRQLRKDVDGLELRVQAIQNETTDGANPAKGGISKRLLESNARIEKAVAGKG